MPDEKSPLGRRLQEIMDMPGVLQPLRRVYWIEQGLEGSKDTTIIGIGGEPVKDIISRRSRQRKNSRKSRELKNLKRLL